MRDYHGYLEDVLGSEDFGTRLDEYDSFINDDEEGIAKGDPNKEGYQGPPDSPETDDRIDNSDKERQPTLKTNKLGRKFCYLIRRVIN